MKIRVTKNQIDYGVRRHSMVCPIAISMVDAGFGDVVVSKDAVYYLMPGKRYKRHEGKDWSYLPFKAKFWMCIFDHLGFMLPFSFDIEVPEHNDVREEEV